MTAAEFKKKWSRYQGKESAAYQEHFIDLCRLLGQPTPVEADPSGASSLRRAWQDKPGLRQKRLAQFSQNAHNTGDDAKLG